ncbi:MULTISPECIES: hypothetical protein [Flavobacterium]|uniref:hypothetical protein n=1 Tax=Flavobacterium TaxID=237 RepID=UPI001FCAB6AC|nr:MULTISPECIES: hypothetical protein [Flavobacterium]UOK42153.1 hypothetical protein LZF87_12645 [Flavobacterium enshiense]
MKFYVKYLFCLLSFLGTAQNKLSEDNPLSIQINLASNDYKDFVSVKNTIYAITNTNDFVKIDFKNDNFKIIKSNITTIAKKSNDELILGSKEGKIFIYKKNGTINQIDKVDAEIFSILIDSKNEYVVYCSKSIYYNKKNYIPKKETNFYGKVRAKYTGTQLIEPDYIYLDKKDFLWFAFDEGEFGGNVCFFDLNKKEFIYEHWLMIDNGGFGEEVKYKDENEYFTKLKETYPDKIKITETDTIYKYPYNLSISSVTKGVAYNNDNDLFITSSGGGHTMLYATEKGFYYYIDGTIVKISKKETDYYKSCFDQDILEDEKYKYAFAQNFMGFKNKDRASRENILTENEINQLGPITYNKYDNKLYFFSSKGFYVLNNSDCTFSKKLFFRPKLSCKHQYESNYCIHLNVTKFEFISEKEILFLTRNNGIGYYNGESVKYLR